MLTDLKKYDPNKYMKMDDQFLDILLDALAGDPKALAMPEVQSINIDNLKAAMEFYANSNSKLGDYANVLAENGWRLMYKRKPPTPEEFLTYEWIGPQSEGLWPNVRKAFVEFCDPNPLNPKRGLALSTSIGWGKSLLSNLIVAYTILQFCFMREPYKVLGHSAMTSYCIALAAYSLNKVWDLLGTPLEQFIEQSPIFEKVPHREDVVNADKLDPACNKIIYSTAGRGSARMLFRNNLQLKMMSTEGHLLGNTIIAAVFTELAWWEQNGWTKEQIKRFFDKACQRVDSRMGGHFLGRYIIDSSPFSLESPIDKWIWEEAVYDPKWYCVLGAKWDYFKNEFPGFFDKNGEEIHNWDVGFQCYKGGKNEPPKCLKSEVEAQLYDPLDLVWCPRLDVTTKGTTQLMSLAMQNPIEFLRDWAGIPAGSSDRIFQAGAVVENIFDNDLKNIYTSIVADAAYEPKDLIWNQIKDKLFINFNGSYMFYREPHAKRVLSVDQSLTGDATGLSVCHWEFEKEKDGVTTHNVCVVDFTLAIIPKGGRINLDAIKDFIMALIEYAGMNIAYVNFDTFQSESTKQYLKRKKIPIEYISVDKDNGPYQTLIDYVTHERLVCGKNIFFKNNLRSLHWSKRDTGSVKIDHFKGKITNESSNTNWDDSLLGTNAKDVADTVAACIAMLTKYDVELAPSTEWRNTKLLGPKSVNETLKKYGFKI